jgi:quercetin dioxygenase-like cupin family protein
VVVRGDGLFKLDDEIIEVETLDAIRVSPKVTRAFEAGDDGLEVLVFGPRRDGDGALDPEFWTD